ncbi:hypothetical protein BD410DRAFT_834774 [Rickenella mellea]|uniref:Uncharacterized protein n=1 Tax=Rickenella mellea TaxID=50990 RepID=A0A4Y7QM62_9AGAM|nr:hypothetical protein BD410DRAFT_834774 [Rickenella mellea]
MPYFPSDIRPEHPQQSVIPSNVYAPQSLPLHSPQPLAFFSGAQSLHQSAAFHETEYSSHPSTPPSAQWVDTPPNTFPTPSELLNELASQNTSGLSGLTQSASNEETDDDDHGHIQDGGAVETLAYVPTDPDAISTHDKKRYYLDSIEQYVLYLHHQLRLVGVEPVPLERVAANRGLSSRSIRTMLVHMQRTAARLHAQKNEDKATYAKLTEELRAPDQPPTRFPKRQINGPENRYKFP